MRASDAAREATVSLIYWLLFGPLGLLVPKSGRRVTVIGRDKGKFVDNAKYAFLAAPGSLDVRFLSEDRTLVERLEDEGFRALNWPGVRAAWHCLRSAAVVVDSAEWTRNGRLPLLCRAHKFQLWHGVPLKEIELALFRRRLARIAPLKRILLRTYKWITGRWSKLDVLVVTSRSSAEQLFAGAFNVTKMCNSGYPRNDVLLASGSSPPGTMINVDKAVLGRCREHRQRGGRICLYAPTFRQHGQSAMDEGLLDLETIDRFCRENDLLFVLKLHPIVNQTLSPNLEHVLIYEGAADVYPLLSSIDILCTDYSSILFDFLLLDRPQVFFPYDLDRYASDDRMLNMDYDKCVPGPIFLTEEELLSGISRALQHDEYAARRASLRAFAFDHVDAGAARRFWQCVTDRS